MNPYQLISRSFIGLLLFLLLPITLHAEPAQAKWKLVTDQLVSPTSMVAPEDGTGRLFITDQTGQIRIINEQGELLEEPLLDLSDQILINDDEFDERGLLGMALHPSFPENGKFYVYYSIPPRPEAPDQIYGTDTNHTSRISTFQVSQSNPNTAPPDTERVLLEVDQPHFNHNGGSLVFGPRDGYLYIGLGDGGSANDAGPGHVEGGNAQDITSLLGSILRIDVEPSDNDSYQIPPGNPFVGREGRDEIYAYGVRNIWGMSFDTGGNRPHLFAADIGQIQYESVLLVGKGGNYGWNIREAFHCFDPDSPGVTPKSCARFGTRGEPLLDPIIEYKNRKVHSDDPKAYGRSVTGGYVYRGEAIPELKGDYLFGDWKFNTDGNQPRAMALRAHRPEHDVRSRWKVTPFKTVNHPDGMHKLHITAFGRDQENEVYLLGQKLTKPVGKNGHVYRLVPADK